MTTTLPTIAVRLENVAVRFPGHSAPRTLLFDTTIESGRITAITGASGSGKSTLLNLVAGFETPDAGRVSILGEDVTPIPPALRPVSVIFQEHNLFAHLDVATNVGLGISPALKLDGEDRERIERALRDVGLAGFARRLPPTLSGGERQRVALARALVRQRPILLLDEPFAALDPGLRQEMGDLLAVLQEKEASTILLVTHHPDDVRRLADRVLFLGDGKVALHEESDAFLRRTEPAAVARFLGARSPAP
ncbi:thiamine ABC transporter ATP-binding protein [Rhizobium sp. 9140]|uniref:thiamine ABC transporter ATP-binding protein n=1 Tax=Rhizobium sp. 9140 TaxID=1761900 RepID=UPI000793CE1D|nr:thiamine ABC transporter ATP-binding protein [Rhizobium sp. 9140]CZT33389.1 thiamine transport system ATP-binding protein [Rhizobium sp. 9140]